MDEANEAMVGVQGPNLKKPVENSDIHWAKRKRLHTRPWSQPSTPPVWVKRERTVNNPVAKVSKATSAVERQQQEQQQSTVSNKTKSTDVRSSVSVNVNVIPQQPQMKKQQAVNDNLTLKSLIIKELRKPGKSE